MNAFRYSYALYIVYLPIVILLMGPTGRNVEWSGTALYFWHLTLTVGLSFAVGRVRWVILERRSLRLKKLFGE